MTSAEATAPRTPRGQPLEIEIGGRTLEAFTAVHHSGSGPGILFLPDAGGLDAGMRARAELFAEEGYCVLAPDLGAGATPEEVAAAAEALRAMPEHDGKTVAIGHGPGGALALDAALGANFDCVVAFDASGITAGALAGQEARARGGGREIVSSLLERYKGPVYLICEDNVVDFFRRFALGLIPETDMPAGLRPKWEYFAALADHMNLMWRA